MKKMSWEPLAEVFLFQGLAPGEMQTLCEELPEPEIFAKGDTVYSRHCFRRSVGIVLTGELRVIQPGDHGGRVVMNRLLPGQICGVAALFGDCEEYVTEILAAANSSVLFLSQEEIIRLMHKDFRVAENYIRFLTDRIRFLNRKITALTDGQSDDRLRRYLLEHGSETGEVELPGSMKELAQMLHMGRSSLYRSLDVLLAEKTVRREGRKLIIEDMQRLKADWI